MIKFNQEDNSISLFDTVYKNIPENHMRLYFNDEDNSIYMVLHDRMFRFTPEEINDLVEVLTNILRKGTLT